MSYTAPVVVASGTTFAQFQAGGASGHLERLIAAQVATLAPVAAPTLAASGAGNFLAAGNYYVVFTESNGFGETTQSPASAVQAVTAGQKLTVTFPALQTGNTSRNVFLGPAAVGPYALYATGITTGTFDCTAATPTISIAVAPPTSNSTGLTSGTKVDKPLELLRGFKAGNGQIPYRYLRQVIEEFNAGRPVPGGNAVTKLQHAHVVFAMLATLCAEAGVLIDANPGTLGTTATGIGNRKTVRTWP